MPLIPIIPIGLEDGRLMTGTISFKGTSALADLTADFRETVKGIVEEYGKGTKIIIVDVNGLRQGAMDLRTIKKIKIRKAEIWLMTFVEDVGDVFDAFYMDIDRLLIPYHSVVSENEMREIVRISDKCVPAIFVENGYAVSRTGKEDVRSAVRKVKGAGFRSAAILDISGRYGPEDWKQILSEFDHLMLFTARASDDRIMSLIELDPPAGQDLVIEASLFPKA